MKSIFKREIAYPKDIQILTGRKPRYSRALYRKIKQFYQKQDHQVITLEELGKYLGISHDRLKEILPE